MDNDKRIDDLLPVKDGLVGGSAADASEVGLLGSKCADCAEASIGTNSVCLNCGSDRIQNIELSSEGTLWTYTVVRHKPPGDYLGPEPFVPFALGLVELPEGVRILAPLEGNVDSFEIGSGFRIVPWILQGKDGKAYKAFKFAQVTS